MPFSGSFGCSVQIFIIRSFFAGISANELCYQWVFRLRNFFLDSRVDLLLIG